MSSQSQIIEIINELQDVFTAVGSSPISLPQLVVVGAQSAAKSSVIESIVGRDFLPRGTGIVTRRPLILQLINQRTDEPPPIVQEKHVTQRYKPQSSTNNNASAAAAAATTQNKQTADEWGEFLHLPAQKFNDFNAIRQEIINETNRVTNAKSISALPITLKIYSPHVLPLTLVDLPGMTKVAVSNQPSDIGAQIDEMILSYIQSPMSIILAVTPSTSDIATSDAIQMAARVDPLGQRTIGVLTKIDLMDRDTDCLPTLHNQLVRLHYGHVGLVCRSQADINANKSVAEGIAAEQRFFANHSAYRAIQARLGTAYLRQRLNKILMTHIQASLPDMRAKIQQTLAETQSELSDYGLSPLSSGESATSLLLPILSKFAAHFSDALDGRAVDVSLNELYGGARISYVFRELFCVSLDSIDVFQQMTDSDIRTAIRNASGSRPSLFIPEISFELLVKKQIERLSLPSLDCVDLVQLELQRVASQCEQLTTQLVRFPTLRDHLMTCVSQLLKERIEPTKAVIHNLLFCEISHINTSHPDFIGGSRAVASIMERIHAKEQHEKRHKSHLNSHHSNQTVQSDDQQQQQHRLNHRSQSTVSPATQHQSGSLSSHSHQLYAPSQGNSAEQSKANGIFSLLFRSPSKSPHANQQQTHINASSTEASPVGMSGAQLSTSVKSVLPASAAAINASLAPLAAGGASNLVSAHMSAHGLRLMAPTEREQIETQVIQTLIVSYFNIVRKNVADMVPKAIMGFQVNYCKKQMQSRLVEQLYRGDKQFTQQLMAESPEMEHKRTECEELIDILHRAMHILDKASEWTD